MRESDQTISIALSQFSALLWQFVCSEISYLAERPQARVITMQGRAGKAPRREMIIESPQQYKCLAEIEAEVEAGSQVAVVSVPSIAQKQRLS